ncbi:MAG: hypothetical protein WDO73_24110 [Ignavibacteriota bacterium]
MMPEFVRSDEEKFDGEYSADRIVPIHEASGNAEQSDDLLRPQETFGGIL